MVVSCQRAVGMASWTCSVQRVPGGAVLLFWLYRTESAAEAGVHRQYTLSGPTAAAIDPIWVFTKVLSARHILMQSFSTGVPSFDATPYTSSRIATRFDQFRLQ